MQTTIISYLHRQYRASILSSTDKEPNFHWLIFEDSELVNLAGGEDSICFQDINGELVCSTPVLALKHPGLVRLARELILAHLRGG